MNRQRQLGNETTLPLISSPSNIMRESSSANQLLAHLSSFIKLIPHFVNQSKSKASLFSHNTLFKKIPLIYLLSQNGLLSLTALPPLAAIELFDTALLCQTLDPPTLILASRFIPSHTPYPLLRYRPFRPLECHRTFPAHDAHRTLISAAPFPLRMSRSDSVSGRAMKRTHCRTCNTVSIPKGVSICTACQERYGMMLVCCRWPHFSFRRGRIWT